MSESNAPDDGVEQARTRLEAIADLPVREHVAAYDDIHALLHDALSTLDEA